MDQGHNKNVKAKQHDSYITMTILCIIVPFVGLIIGAVYMTKDTALDKKLGEHMVAFSILMGIIGFVGWMILGSMTRVGII